jgi:hypothetical protein
VTLVFCCRVAHCRLFDQRAAERSRLERTLARDWPIRRATKGDKDSSLLGLLRSKTNENIGYLRVYTDTNVLVNGGLDSNNVRRSFDLYAPDGTLIRADGRYGEEPVWLRLTPGRYVVASMYGTTYRKVQVEVSAGETLVVPASVLREASPVFAQ